MGLVIDPLCGRQVGVRVLLGLCVTGFVCETAGEKIISTSRLYHLYHVYGMNETGTSNDAAAKAGRTQDRRATRSLQLYIFFATT